MNNWLANTSQVVPLALSVFFALMAVLSGAGALRSLSPSLFVKMTGSALVLSLAFSANQTWTYGIAMFVVATLVTELEFLEKLAAIFWRSDSYFKWRIATATPSEIETKRRDEAGEAEVGEKEKHPPSEQKTDLALRGQQFENEVAAAIAAGTPPFAASGTLRRNIIFSRRGDTLAASRIADMIYERDDIHYLIEVKTRFNPRLSDMRSLTKAYQEYLAERTVDAVVIPMLILPVEVPQITPSLTDIIVLRFDGTHFSGAESLPSF